MAWKGREAFVGAVWGAMGKRGAGLWDAVGLLQPPCGLRVYCEDSGAAGEGTVWSLGSWPGLLSHSPHSRTK